MIKKIIALAALLIAASSFSPAMAGSSAGMFTGCLTTADASGPGVGYFGGFVGFGDHVATVYGTFTYGMAEYTDIRFKLGFSDPDAPQSDPRIMLGFDFKYELMDYEDTLHKNPFDLAAGAFIEYADFEFSPLLQLGGDLIGSIPYRFKSGQKIIPYARLNVRMERVDPDGHDANTDFEAGLNFGAKFELTQDFNLYGEFQIDGNTGIYLGMDIRAF